MKVFGIGLSKTGTKSLGRALEILGLRTEHFPIDMLEWSGPGSAKFALYPCNEYAARFSSEFFTLRWLLYSNWRNEVNLHYADQYDALCDLPVSNYYREFDELYPDAKFVLTLRPLDAWLRSAEAHFSVKRSPQHYHHRNRLRLDTYNTILFREDLFAEAYHRHTRNVRNYFAGRQGKLLEMNVQEGDGWSELCSFLGYSAPKVDFPHLNKAAKA